MLEARPPSVAPAAPGDAVPAAAEGDRTDALGTEVAKAVRELRAAAGLSERAAARILGTSQTQLRRMEDPRYLPSLRSLARVAAAYGHRLRIEFAPRVPPGGSRVPPGGSKDRQPSKSTKPAPRVKALAARAKRPPAAQPARQRPRRRV